ncbi:putative NBD/HSP70 family sugar kinase [Flavimobilis soli]|uniref:Putative NBD/HSP70 family sugar kinase n=1 Tax=Flavimobilis soli TaxID=442709 RepID=A0A2A9EFM8_9MICO|nr:ROK family protein [Flavimobilis soli]PFG37728.1 putative NBD/HSP70 family sugar kinase [Flavimobilis soli]
MAADIVKAPSRPSGAGEMFQLLRDGAPRTRAELAQITGQARSTIAARVEQLLASGLVAPTGEAASTGGRPPATFAFNPAARIVLGVDLGATHATLALTDLASDVLAEHSEPLDIALGPGPVLERVVAIAHELLAAAGRARHEIASVGVGVPGPVDHETGRPKSPPIMPGWDDADVPAILHEALGAPVLVDNDVNIMALGEHATSWPDVDHLLFVKIATGIGAGIISDGEIRRGAQGAAGDLGHVAVPDRTDVVCRCGNTGCLEAVAGGAALVERLRTSGRVVTSTADLVALLRAGDTEAVQAVRQAGRDVGAVLATCVNMLNPSMVVIGGVVGIAAEQLIAGIREVVYRRSLPLATQHLRIVASRSQQRAGVLGASVMAAEHVLSAPAVEALLL